MSEFGNTAGWLHQLDRGSLPIKHSAPPPAGQDDPARPRSCGTCRWADPDQERCLWAEQNAMPLGLPFWMDRATVAYVDSDEGADCGAFEARQSPGGGR